MTQARQLWEMEPVPEDDEDLVERGLLVIEETGDLPEELWFEAVMRARDQKYVSQTLLDARPDDGAEYDGGFL